MAGTRGRRKNNSAGKRCVLIIVFAFVAVMSVQITRTSQKDKEYQERQAALEKQLENEMKRAEELEDYEAYMKSREYVEDTAKSKLGLAYENEIIFKER